MQIGLRRGFVDLEVGMFHGQGQQTKLTGRELELLRYLVERSGQTVPREELLTEVFGFHPQAKTRVLATTLRRLRQRIDDDGDAPEHLHTVYGEGVRFVPLPEQSAVDGTLCVGRDAVLRELHQLVAGVVWLCGGGGLGKTTVARRYGEQVVGARWVDLSLVEDAERLLPSIRDQLQLARGAELEDWLGRQDRPLLVLDNAEHLFDAVQQLAQHLQQSCGSLRLVITSRRSPAVGRVIRLEPLAEANIAWLVRHHFGELDERLTREVCAQADGNPLVVDLLVRRAKRLGLGAALAGGLASLRGSARRHATADETVWRSVQDLPQHAVEVLARMACLRGTATAEAWLERLGLESAEAVEVLIEHGIVESTPAGLKLLPLTIAVIRQRQCRDEHWKWALATSAKEAARVQRALTGPSFAGALAAGADAVVGWVDVMERLEADVSAAVALVEALSFVVDEVHSASVEAALEAWKERLLSRAQGPRARVALARIALGCGRRADAEELLDAVDVSTLELCDLRLRSHFVAGRYGEIDAAAVALHDDAMARGNEPLAAVALLRQGTAHGASDRGQRCFEQAQVLAERAGYALLVGKALVSRGLVASRRGEPREALRLYEQAQEVLDGHERGGLPLKLRMAMADALHHAGRLDEALQRCDGIRIDALRAGAVGVVTEADTVRMRCLMLSGQAKQAVDEAYTAVLVELPTRNWFAVMGVTANLAYAGILCGDAEAVVVGVGHVLDAARHTGRARARGPGLALAALLFAVGGQPRTARRLLERARSAYGAAVPVEQACLDLVDAVLGHYEEHDPRALRALVRGATRAASGAVPLVDRSGSVRVFHAIWRQLTRADRRILVLSPAHLARVRRRLEPAELEDLSPA